MSTSNANNRPDAWVAAARLIARWLERSERIDELLDTLGGSLNGPERARCQHLVFGVVRHFGRIAGALEKLVAHPPRFATRAVLFVAGFELIEAQGKSDAAERDGLVAKIVHHAVEQTKTLASPAEARLVNAVVRKLAGALATPPPPKLATAEVLGEYFSHPAWLVRSWLVQFGAEGTRALLEWNQQPAPVYARWRGGEAERPEWLRPTAWPGYFEVAPGHWSAVEPLLSAGKIYLQDPATRLAVELLAPQAGEAVLDACAAPGGKSVLMADTMQSGQVVAFDLPSARIDRLKQNLAHVPATVNAAIVQGDLREQAGALLKEHGLPQQFPAVLLDVPCSNTGVMRHRVDVKWRLQEGDFKKHPRQQLSLLHDAARLVAPGGRLVYSTCSIDSEENEHVVREFLGSKAGAPFKLASSVLSFPWVTGHDGAGAFLLRKE